MATSAHRQIVLDTETTGLEWQKGNRVVEIGCVELLERRPTGPVSVQASASLDNHRHTSL